MLRGGAYTTKTPCILTGGDDGVAGQEGCQVGLDTDGTHPRAAAAVRDAEGLVQVEMADVRANVSRRGQAHLH